MTGLHSTETQPAQENTRGSGETILLVEAEDATRAMIGTVLRRHGYRVLEAATPADACEIAAIPTTEIDLLVTNIVIHDIGGPGLAQRLVGDRPQLKVLFVSDQVELPFRTTHPNVSLLGKPFRALALLAKVNEALARPKMTP